MPTLYVENVPDELYSALRQRARQHRKSIAAEVLSLLEENVVTPAELKERQLFLRRIRKLASSLTQSGRVYPTTEEMQRQDRDR
jgi:plasmid stability protein